MGVKRASFDERLLKASDRQFREDRYKFRKGQPFIQNSACDDDRKSGDNVEGCLRCSRFGSPFACNCYSCICNQGIMMINQLSKYTSILVVGIGVFVMISWFADFDLGKSLTQGKATMKFSTALCAVQAGVASWIFSLRNRKDFLDVIAVMLMMANVVVMQALLIAHLSGVASPLTIFASEDNAIAKASLAGIPSLCTIFLFFLKTVSSVTWIVKMIRATRVIGWILIVSGSVVLLGHLFGAEKIYCYLSGNSSSAMAVLTAVVFVLLGISIIWRSQVLYLKCESE